MVTTRSRTPLPSLPTTAPSEAQPPTTPSAPTPPMTKSDALPPPLSTPQTPLPPPPLSTPPASSHYEKCREERIRENLERIQKLGLLDLSHQLNSSVSVTNRSRKRTAATAIERPSLPSRRSSRLQSVSPVSYVEVDVKKDKEFVKKVWNELKVEEAYTEEHEKLLGSCETEWTLFVDGYGRDRKRIYDQAKGKTCHQCRQKTLGHRTSCSRCQIVQGQFCGDCLFMRYGENVLEAKKNPNWICPVCRGICNCSICRTNRGWPPTGYLYRTVVSLGYKSVAHYLIQTRRVQTNSGNPSPVEPVSAKKSLNFTEEPRTELEGMNSNSNENNDNSSAEKGLGGSDKNCVKNVVNDESLTEVDGSAEKSGLRKSDKKCAKNVVNSTSARITRSMSKVTGS